MELAQLRYFCDVAETEHMTKSARRLNVVQPALSRSVHGLEDELGVKLFEKSGRNIKLTQEGARFYERASAVLGDLDAATSDLRSYAAVRESTARIGVFSATNLVVDAIAAYAGDHQDTVLELAQDEGDEACDVTVSTLAASTASGARNGAMRPVRDERTYVERIGVAVPLGSSCEGSIALKDLEGERLVSLAGSRRLRSLCDALCHQHGFEPRIGFDSESPEAVKKVISLGLGLGFWPEVSWGSLDGSGARWVPLREEGFVRTLSVKLMDRGRSGSDSPKPVAEGLYAHLTGFMDGLWQDRA